VRPVPVALALLVAVPVPARAQDPIDRRLPADRDVAVRLANLVGSTRITGWDRDTVAITGSLPAGVGTLYAGGTRAALKIAVEGPEAAERYAGATLEVRVPRGARLLVKSTSADIAISGITGEIDLGSALGRVTIEGAPRSIVAETVTGNIEVAGAPASVRLRSGGGTIIVRGARGDLTVSTVSGTISVGGGAITRARLESTAGAIDYKGSVAPGGSLEVQTHSGDVTLRLPPATGADVELGTVAGAVSSEFGPVPPATAKGRPRRVTLGDGSAAITVRTFTGAIALVKQP